MPTEDAFGYTSVLPLSANRADLRARFSDTPVLSRLPPRPATFLLLFLRPYSRFLRVRIRILLRNPWYLLAMSPPFSALTAKRHHYTIVSSLASANNIIRALATTIFSTLTPTRSPSTGLTTSLRILSTLSPLWRQRISHSLYDSKDLLAGHKDTLVGSGH